MTNSIFEKGFTTKREVKDIVKQSITDQVDIAIDNRKNVSNGIAGLDANAKILLTQIPGGVKILQSQPWNAYTNTPDLLTIQKEIGYCWIVSIAGNTNLSGYTDWQSGDEVIYLGSNNFVKIDNTDNTSLQKTANLSDLTNNATARTNLDVYSKTETDNALDLKAPRIDGEPNGFIDTTQISLSWDEATRTLTIAKVGDSFSFYANGVKYTKTANESITISNDIGNHFVYFDNNGLLQETTTFTSELILRRCYVAFIYWTGTASLPDAQIETHGCEWASEIHLQQHLTIGTKYESGLALSLVVDGIGNSNSHIQLTAGSGIIWDEDIKHNINSRTATQILPIIYRSGVNGWDVDKSASFIAKKGINRAYYNQNVSGNWQLTELANNDYAVGYIYVAPSISYQWFVVMGQQSYSTLPSARDGARNAPSLGSLPLQEFKLVGAVIYQTSDSYSNSAKARIVSIDGITPYVDWRQSIAIANNANILSSDIVYLQNQLDIVKDKTTNKNIKTWYISGGVNGSGSDLNDGFTPNSAFSTLAYANTKLGNTGEMLIHLPSAITESAEFSQYNIEITGYNASHRGICGTTGTYTSKNNNIGSQTYSYLSLGSFVKSPPISGTAGYVKLVDVNIATSYSDSSNAITDNFNLVFNATTPISITGSGIKNFYNQRGGIFTVNNAGANVNVITNDYISQFTLTAGLISVRDAIIYIASGTTFTIGTSGATFIAENVRFLYPDNTIAKINIPIGVNYSLQNNCIYDNANSTLNGTNISSLYTGYFDSIINNSIILKSATANTILATNTNKQIQSLTTATYPSLTELSYVKGVTSSLQSQLSAKLSSSDKRVGTKEIDETNIGDNKIQVYNASTGKLEYRNNTGGGGSSQDILTYFINATDFVVSGSGNLVTLNWNAQTDASQYKIYVKKIALGNIDIVQDTPAATINSPNLTTNIVIEQGVTYSYAILVQKTANIQDDTKEFTTLSEVSNFSVDSFDLSAGTTATLTWSSFINATEYRIQYQRSAILSNPTTISGMTTTSRTITGLTPSNPDDASTPYSFKVLAYNSSGSIIAESPTITRPVFANINLKYFYDSSSSIAINSITRSGPIATITTATTNGLKQADVISISGTTTPFNVNFALVRRIINSSQFEIMCSDSGSSSFSGGNLTVYQNAFITWSYYKFSQYLTSLETSTKKLIPIRTHLYSIFGFDNARMIFNSTKYSNSGDYYAGWYLVKTHSSYPSFQVLTDTDFNCALYCFANNGVATFSDQRELFLVPAQTAQDDHRSYKVWNGGKLYFASINTNSISQSIFQVVNKDLTVNLSLSSISPSPPSADCLPATLLLSGFIVWFDNNNQRLITMYKDGTRQNIFNYSTLGLTNLYGFSTNIGGGVANISQEWYVKHDNVNKIIIGNFANPNIGCFLLQFDFENNAISVSSPIKSSLSVYSTEENCFGYELVTFFNLTNNKVEILSYSASSPTPGSLLKFNRITNIFNGNPDSNISTFDLTVPGQIGQIGWNPANIIKDDGSVYFFDYGHDNSGLYRYTGDDDGAGMVKINDMSVHTKLLNII